MIKQEVRKREREEREKVLKEQNKLKPEHLNERINNILKN